MFYFPFNVFSMFLDVMLFFLFFLLFFCTIFARNLPFKIVRPIFYQICNKKSNYMNLCCNISTRFYRTFYGTTIFYMHFSILFKCNSSCVFLKDRSSNRFRLSSLQSTNMKICSSKLKIDLDYVNILSNFFFV